MLNKSPVKRRVSSPLVLLTVLAVAACAVLAPVTANASTVSQPPIPKEVYDTHGAVPADVNLIKFDAAGMKVEYADNMFNIVDAPDGSKFVYVKALNNKGGTYLLEDTSDSGGPTSPVLTVKVPFYIQGSRFYLELSLHRLYYGNPKRDGAFVGSLINCFSVLRFSDVIEFDSFLMSTVYKDNLAKQTLPGCKRFDSATYLKGEFSYNIIDSNNRTVNADFPHNLIFSDIDAGTVNKSEDFLGSRSLTAGFFKGTPEAVEFGQGFSKIRIPSAYAVGRSDKMSGAGHYAKNIFFNNVDHNYSGDDSFKYAGVVATPELGVSDLSFSMQEYWSGTTIGLSSSLLTAAPDKTGRAILPNGAGSTQANVGGVIEHTVTVKLPEFGVSIFDPVRTFKITDTLPKGLDLVSVTAMKNDTLDLSKFVTVKGNTWTFEPDAKWRETEYMKGGSVRFTVKSKVNKQADSSIINCVKASYSHSMSDISSCSNPITVIKPKVTPNVKIEKLGNGVSSHGKQLTTLKGSSVEFSYKVTNTGDDVLNMTSLSDSKLGAIKCDRTTLKPNESVVCKAKGTV